MRNTEDEADSQETGLLTSSSQVHHKYGV